MNAHIRCLNLTACVLVLQASSNLAQAQPAPWAYAEVSAQWGNLTPIMNSASDVLLAQPADAMVVDFIHGGPPGTLFGDMTAGAWSRASASTFPAVGEKALRSASFVDEAGSFPDPPSQLPMEAISTARVVTQWIVSSDGSYTSPTTALDASLSFDGYLFGVNGFPWTASVDVTMNVYVNGVLSTVFQGGGQYDNLAGSGRRLTASGGFLDSFNPGTRPPNVPANGAWLDFNEPFDGLLNVNVGETFLVELILQTRATGRIIDGEMLVRSEFFDSGNFQLSTGDIPGLTLTQIPAASPVPDLDVATLRVLGSHPNPFNPSSTIKYFIGRRALVELNIYNLRGELVRALLRDHQDPGEHVVTWNGLDGSGEPVAGGVYLVQVTANGDSQTHKMALIK